MQGIPNPRSIFHKLTQNVITDWINKQEGFPMKNGQPIMISTDDLERKKKRHYHAIRNQEYWMEWVNLEELRAHMKSKIKVAKKDEQSVF
mgnify:FL=1